MSDEVFSFTPEQKVKLEKWRSFLTTEQANDWALMEDEAIESLHKTLIKEKFEEGNDLSPEKLNSLIHYVRGLINNRAIARTLYDNNGLSNFNSKLRILFFGKEPFAKRVDQFMELKGVGYPTVSQFLCAFDPIKYPEITTQTLDIIGLDSTQLNDAYRQALKENNITSPQDYLNYTLDYLSYAIIFRQIKILLSIERYNYINNMLWLAYTEVEPEVKLVKTTVSLEEDLRDHLAENPSLIEAGLSLVEKEFNITGAGRADILCTDKKGNYVVIETKKGRESDKVVGQILRYIGGLKKEGKKVRGIIIVNERDDKLDFAIEAVKDFIRLKYYKIKFEINDNYIEE